MPCAIQRSAQPTTHTAHNKLQWPAQWKQRRQLRTRAVEKADSGYDPLLVLLASGLLRDWRLCIQPVWCVWVQCCRLSFLASQQCKTILETRLIEHLMQHTQHM